MHERPCLMPHQNICGVLIVEYYQGWNHGVVKIPHGNMSPEDLLRMTKKTCPCYTKVFKFRGKSQWTYVCMRDHV